jgi:hypothetical protein
MIPLLLVVVGTDLFRWVSLSMLNLFVVTLVLVRIHPEADMRFHPSWKALTVLVGLGLLAGPIGIERPFPLSRLVRPFHLAENGGLVTVPQHQCVRRYNWWPCATRI